MRAPQLYMTKFKNQEEWAKGKKWSDYINGELKMYNDEIVADMKGFIYPDAAYIELLPSGEWHTIVANYERSDYDLRAVEQYLWSAHSHANREDDQEILIKELSAFCSKSGLPHKSADELLAVVQVEYSEYLRKTGELGDQVEWLTKYIQRWEDLMRIKP